MNISPFTSKTLVLRNGSETSQAQTPIPVSPTAQVPTIQVTPQWQDSKAFRVAGQTALLAGFGALGGIVAHALKASPTTFGSAVNTAKQPLEQNKSLRNYAILGTAIGAGIGLLWGALRGANMKSPEALARERYEKDQRVQLLNTGQVNQYQAVPVLSAGVHTDGVANASYFVQDRPVEVYSHHDSNDFFTNMLLWHMMSNNNRSYETHHYHYNDSNHDTPRSSSRSRGVRTSGTTSSNFHPSPSGMKSSGRGFGTSRLSSSSSGRSSSSRSSRK